MAELAQSHTITVAVAKSHLLRARTTIKNSRTIVNAIQRSRPSGPQAKRGENAGRNQHGFSLHNFSAPKRGGGVVPSPLSIVC
jgi:hypothetical protein